GSPPICDATRSRRGQQAGMGIVRIHGQRSRGGYSCWFRFIASSALPVAARQGCAGGNKTSSSHQSDVAGRLEKGIMLRMSRAQLHQLIWSKPMTEIARAYGVRGQHIANACDEHEIARPPAGYWQKLEYGKAVESVALDNSNY